MLMQFPYSSLRAWLRTIYGDAPLMLEPWYIPVNFGDVVASARVSKPAQILANADFILCGVTARCESASNLKFKLQISDTGSGAQFFSAPIWVEAIAGGLNSRASQQWVYPRFVGGNSALMLDFTAGAVDTEGSYVTLNGFNVRGLN